MKKILSIVLALALVFALAACGADKTPATTDNAAASDNPAEPVKLRVGASPTPHAEILNSVKDRLLKEYNIDLEVVEYSDYVVPNNVVEDGTVLANYFQHTPYLDDFNAQNGTHIVSVLSVHVEPLGLYGGKQSTLDALQ